MRRVLLTAGTSFTALALVSLVSSQNLTQPTDHFTTPSYAAPRSQPMPSRSQAPSIATTPAKTPASPPATLDTDASARSTDGNPGGDTFGAQVPSPPGVSSGIQKPANDISLANTGLTPGAPGLSPVSTATDTAKEPATPARPISAVSGSDTDEKSGLPDGSWPFVDRDTTNSAATRGYGGTTAPSHRRGIRSGLLPRSVMISPGSGATGYVSVRNTAGRSGHEIERISRALEAGGSGGRDLADLYHQRALLYLNQSDNERAAQDFRRAVEAFKSRIQRGDRLAEARRGLSEAQNGLKQASQTIVY